MTSLVLASLRHYRGLHALVVAGVTVAVAVLAGALLVGASVRESLRDLALARLGSTDLVVTSATFFRAALGEAMRSPEIAAVAPVLAVPGAVVHESSRRTAAQVQVFGIDDRFFGFHERPLSAPTGRDAWISPGLAVELGASQGDNILLRVAKPTDIPLSSLQGRRDDTSERVRLTVARVASRDELGEFSLMPAQGPALSIFVPLSRLQQDLELANSANALLVRMAPPLRDAVTDVQAAVAAAAELEDIGLKVRTNAERTVSILESRTGLLPGALANSAALRARDHGGTPSGVLTYLANSIRANGRETPYSLIAAIDLPGVTTGRDIGVPVALPPIRLNEWAVDDLRVAVGDRVDVDYYLWSDQAGLQTRTAAFTFAGTVPMSGVGGDSTLTPEYPGITDAADVTSWDPPFPVDMSKVRKKDEEYWDRWRSAPKAFIPLEVGQRLWPSTFGSLSSLRTPYLDNWPPVTDVGTVLAVRDVRREAVEAAAGTTDFGEYFIYFSFFLVVSALLLAGMFFALSVEQRAKELGLLLAVGYRASDVRRVLLTEAAVLAGAGSLLGIVGAIGYAAVIMYGLRTWWIGAVGTTALQLHVDPLLLVAGAGGALLSAVAALTLSFRRLAQRSARGLLAGGVSERAITAGNGGTVAAIAIALAVTLMAVGLGGWLPPVAAFFGAGGLLLVAGCSAFARWLRRASPRLTTPAASGRADVTRGGAAQSSARTSIPRFGAAYARWRPTRSVLSAALIAFACFVIVSVGAFRRDASGLSLAKDSGTGGFLLMAESVAPLMHNPNLAVGREDLSIAGYPELEAARVTRFRLRPGDEASCLTLYQPRNPRLVAPEASFLTENRFTFAQSLAETDEERANPWLLLNRRFADGAVPAIADQTSLTYVFHLKVGDDFEFASDGGAPTKLRIVATLADSVLQSELIIGETEFVRLFPAYEGYRVWMIEAPENLAASLTTLLEDRLSDFGVDVTDTRARLASYHEVENTYLSTFQALGALGLLLGTIGLGAVLARNVLERRRELGVLGAIGFTPAHLRTMVAAESLLLVVSGVAIGTVSALVAVAPAVVQRVSSFPFVSLGLLVVGVIATGVLAALAAVRFATATKLVEAIKTE